MAVKVTGANQAVWKQFSGSNAELVGSAEFCERAGISRWTLYGIFNDGLLPFVIIGKRKKVPRTAFESWLKGRNK